MKIAGQILIVLLVLLSLASGIAKILLVPQDVAFFGQYGFGNAMLIGFGVMQIAGGILIVSPRTRAAGSLMVFLTFLVSGVLLLHAGNIPVGAFTLVITLLLGALAFKSLKPSVGAGRRRDV